MIIISFPSDRIGKRFMQPWFSTLPNGGVMSEVFWGCAAPNFVEFEPPSVSALREPGELSCCTARTQQCGSVSGKRWLRGFKSLEAQVDLRKSLSSVSVYGELEDRRREIGDFHSGKQVQYPALLETINLKVNRKYRLGADPSIIPGAGSSEPECTPLCSSFQAYRMIQPHPVWAICLEGLCR